jgi:hypothetical protein
MLPGADGAFVGGQDDMVAVLSNSGRSLSVYETSKLGSTAAKPLYSAELKEGLVAAVYPGGWGGVAGWRFAGSVHRAMLHFAVLFSFHFRPLLLLNLESNFPSRAGPPAHIPGPPAPRPASLDSQAAADAADSDDSDAGEDDEAAASRQEWEAGERRRLELPRLVLLRTQSNQ